MVKENSVCLAEVTTVEGCEKSVFEDALTCVSVFGTEA